MIGWKEFRSYAYLLRHGKFKECLRAHHKIRKFRQSGLLFIHIPKTAGVSLHRALYGSDSFGHLPASYYKIFFGDREWSNLKKISVVRHPYSRLFSAFSYLKNGGRGSVDDIKAQRLLAHIPNFESFVLHHLNRSISEEIVHFQPQYGFLTDSNGRLLMDYVGKVEDIDEVQREISQMTDFSFKLSRKENRTVYHSSLPERGDLFEKVYEMYKEDYHLFSYTKNVVK